MKRAIPHSVLATALLTACYLLHAGSAHAQAADATTVRYTVKLLTKDLGAKPTIGYSINNLGWVAGRAQTTQGGRQAILWRDGNPTPLGALAKDRNSMVRWPVKNTIGLVSGISHTSRIDPLNERFSCGAFLPAAASYVCRGFVWRNGAMRELPTFGSADTHGFATGTNNHAQTVGWAEFDALDASCVPGNAFNQQRRFSAALWGPEPDRIRELPPLPLPGHSTSAATAINDHGQVVGISGKCDQGVGRESALEAVLWENGLPQRIPNLGGNGWHTPNMINENGVVVGFSAYDPALPADSAKTQGFLWSQATGLEPIAFLAGDDDATANSINNHDQVVGMSCGAVCRAYVWQDGRSVDLNALRQPGSSSNAILVSANDIDDLGRITGQALYRPKGASADVVVAFVASPVED